MTTELARTGLVETNGTKLYHEIRGDGPPAVFIAGGAGDAGFFEHAAELLADDFTVVTYDRRGDSRSPRPPGWTSTSMPEQADDCASLIDALGLERPAVFGNSMGGTILVSLLERHAQMLRGAIVHEPALPESVAPSATDAATELMQVISEGIADGGPEKAMELMLRWVNGAAFYEAADRAFLSRVVANADVNLTIEIPGSATFTPDPEALAAAEVPVHAAYGEQTAAINPRMAAWVREAAEWVAEATGGQLHAFPGAHLSFYDRPAEFAEALHPILVSMLR